MEPVNIMDAKAWSSVDIFLFSNGQQYSPPRKYHLRSEELQWWGSTVSYLGRTHYGSGHSSIDLYTIDGTKVNGPLELINGAAYVAVEPPDPFIGAGYEEYLLRASRSFEKRLAQKLNSETSNLDSRDSQIKNAVYDTGTPLTSITAETTSLKVANISPQKPTKPQQRLQRNTISNSKTIQKKKSLDCTAIKRIRAETDKISPCPGRNSIKANEIANRKFSTNFSRNINRNRQQSTSYKEREIRKSDTIEDSKINSVQSSAKTFPLFPYNGGLNLKTEAQENCNSSDTGPSKEQPVVGLYETKERDLASIITDPDNSPIIDSIAREKQNDLSEDHVLKEDDINDTENDKNQRIEKPAVNQLKQTNEYQQNNLPLNYNGPKYDKDNNAQVETPVLENYKDYKFDNDNTFSIKSVYVSEKEVSDEYIAYMRKGGVILLKLKIKFKDCKMLLNKDRINNSQMTTSLTNLPKTEKTSQVDININISGELLKANDDQYNENPSLQSLLNKLYSDNTENGYNKNPKIVILQCACRNYSDKHKCSMDDTTFCRCAAEELKYKTMPKHKLNETFTCCQCNDRSFEASNDENFEENVMEQRSSKVTTDETPRSFSKCNGGRIKKLAQIFEGSNGVTPNEKYYKNQNNNQSPMTENNKKAVVLTSPNIIPIPEKSTGYPVKEEDKFKTICDDCTQTDWCDVLLEARRHEGDYYTFHIPSLHFIKQCNL